MISNIYEIDKYQSDFKLSEQREEYFDMLKELNQSNKTNSENGINVISQTLLHHACILNDAEKVIRILSSNMCDINSKYIYFDADDNYYGKTALIIAVENENIEIVKHLVSDDRTDVNLSYVECSTKEYDYCDFEEKTALIIAVEKNNTEIVKLLLSNPKTNVNMLHIDNSEFGGTDETALSIAIYGKNIEIVKLLLADSRTDVNLTDKMHSYGDQGGTDETHVLVAAAQNNNVEIVKLLVLDPRTKLNERQEVESYERTDNDGNTALHYAVKNKNIEMIKLLLNCEKINTDIKNYNGKTAIMLTDDPKIKALFHK